MGEYIQNLKPCFSEMNSSSSNLLETNHNYQAPLTYNHHHQQKQILPFSNHQHLSINFPNFFNASSSSPSAVSGTGVCLTENIKNMEGGRKRKRNGKDMEKPKEVIHVRAKRGQATDSHSLAERVRREKINEKLRCLQDLVPGCYKTMGMAVMLDVIINYVQSLQNQIEFLSMKLSAASMHYDLCLERDTIETLQATYAYELQEMERMERDGYGGASNYFHSAWPL